MPSARRPIGLLPVVGCVPGSDVWFVRFIFAFLSHLQQGGHVIDRLNGQCIGNPAGPAFNFDHMSGGPLLWLPDLLPSRHLFIGHTVCPGFNRISLEFDGWAGLPFSASGDDYLHAGLDYAHVPVDLAPHAFIPVSVGDVDAAAWTDPRQRTVLVYGDPIDKAVVSFSLRQGQTRPSFSRAGEGQVVPWPFHDYLFKHALPSFAKMMMSYQAMAQAVPGSVQIVPEDALRGEPVRVLSSVLAHLNLDHWDSRLIDAVIALSRPEHIAAIEKEVGRNLTGFRRSRKATVSSTAETAVRAARDPNLRRKALALLASMGVDTAWFESSPPSVPVRAVAGRRSA